MESWRCRQKLIVGEKEASVLKFAGSSKCYEGKPKLYRPGQNVFIRKSLVSECICKEEPSVSEFFYPCLKNFCRKLSEERGFQTLRGKTPMQRKPCIPSPQQPAEMLHATAARWQQKPANVPSALCCLPGTSLCVCPANAKYQRRGASNEGLSNLENFLDVPYDTRKSSFF